LSLYLLINIFILSFNSERNENKLMIAIHWDLELSALISSFCMKWIIWISVFRSVRCFCEYLKNSNNTQMIVSLLPSIMDNLVGMATQYSSEVLSLVMETLALVLSVSYLTVYNIIHLIFDVHNYWCSKHECNENTGCVNHTLWQKLIHGLI
jgi:hypothetical protein